MRMYTNSNMHHVAISTWILGTWQTCTHKHHSSSNCLLVDRTSVAQANRLSTCADKTRLDVNVSLAEGFPFRRDGRQVTLYGHPCMPLCGHPCTPLYGHPHITLYGHPCKTLYGHPCMTLYGHPCTDARLTFASSWTRTLTSYWRVSWAEATGQWESAVSLKMGGRVTLVSCPRQIRFHYIRMLLS